ncbi:MAG: redoxin domain-containing protein [Sphingobacteriales bacterium]|nr:MAG: redoxin domain-containing protein [Sphingobacteriales bacterium]
METKKESRLKKWNHNKNGAILVFFSTTCPICLNHIIELDSIYNICKRKNIGMYLILPHSLYLRSNEIKIFKDSLNINIPIVIDKKNKITEYNKATVMPQAMLLDSNRVLKYKGQITNKFVTLGVRKNHTITNYLNNALDSYLKKQPIDIEYTEPMGCVIEKYK